VSSRNDAAIALRFKQCYITNVRSAHLQYAAEQLPLADSFAMRLFRFFVALSAFLWATEATNDGLTDVVSWDPYSLTVNGSRVFVL
jgi:hypothetical protein